MAYILGNETLLIMRHIDLITDVKYGLHRTTRYGMLSFYNNYRMPVIGFKRLLRIYAST